MSEETSFSRPGGSVSGNQTRKLLQGDCCSTVSGAREFLAAGKITLLSLDVFDTLLWRPFRWPHELFTLMPRAVPHALSPLSVLDAQTVSTLRQQAEAQARRRAPGGEAKHAEIAMHFAERIGVENHEFLLNIEMELERANLFPHDDLFKLISYANDIGIPYVLCSDMYLSSEQIAELVKRGAARCGVIVPDPVAVLVSCEHRTGKSGHLFEKLIRETGVPAAQILHIGDNLRADVHGAERKGLKALHLRRTCEKAEQILDAEEYYVEALNNEAHDFGLSTTRKQVFAEEDLNSNGAMNHKLYGAFIAGPVFAAFANWVVESCSRSRRETVYCLMREGHFLARLINEVARMRSVPLVARPLWVSRFAIRSAELSMATAADVNGFLHRVRPIDIQADLMEELGVFGRADSEEWIREGLPTANFRQKTAFITAKLASSSGRIKRVRELAERRKSSLMAYLAGENFTASEKATVVDLGWGGTIQAALARLVRREKSNFQIEALYLATDERIDELDSASSPWESFLYVAAKPTNTCSILQRTPELLEQFTMCPSGSLKEFSPDGTPILFPHNFPKEQAEQVEQIQSGILEFTKKWTPRYEMSGGPESSRKESESLRNRLRSIIARSLDDPVRDEVLLFEKWMHDSNNGSNDLQPILGNTEATQKLLSGRIRHPLQLDWTQSYWPQGLFVYHKKTWRKPKLLQTRNRSLRGFVKATVRSIIYRLPRPLSFALTDLYHNQLKTYMLGWR